MMRNKEKIIGLSAIILFSAISYSSAIDFSSLNNISVKNILPKKKKKDLETKYGDKSKLGTILEINMENEPSFIIFYINNGYNFRPDLAKDYLEYDALAQCLQRLNIEYKGKAIAAPLIGCNRFDGNGDKEKVVKLLNTIITNVDLDIYDYYQKSRNEELIEIFKEEEKMKSIDYNKYREMVKKRKAEAKLRKEKNGTAGY
jgi:hypothetical protein